MRCKNCHYALWNITARVCPECGSSFRPGDFEFQPNAVRYCCPTCDQTYYGTDAKGHLEPPEFECVQCGNHVAMDDMVIRPETDDDADVTAPLSTMPWFDHRQRGMIRAWLATIGAAMTRPRRLMAAIPEQTTLGTAWTFMFLSTITVLLVGNVLPTVVVLIGTLVAGRHFTSMKGVASMMFDVSLAGWGMTVVALAVLPPIWALIAHGLMRLTGPVRVGLGRTVHAIMFSAAAAGIALVPCGIEEVGMVWWVVSAVLMVQAAHACHGFRAAFAVVTAALVMFIPMMAAMTVMFLGATGMGLIGGTSTGSPVQIVTDAIIQHAATNGSRGPRHVAELIADGTLQGGDLLDVDTSTTLLTVPLGDQDLATFVGLPPNGRTDAAQAAGEALPADTVAYRLGDFVFADRGVTLPGAGVLWIVIQLPDPDLNGTPGPRQRVYIGRDDGSTITVRAERLPLLLMDQNVRRGEAGLPPLPDLTSVTHGQPVRADEN